MAGKGKKIGLIATPMKTIQVDKIVVPKVVQLLRKVNRDDPAYLATKNSIKDRGLLQPINVRVLEDMPGFYGLVNGLHRFTAIQDLGGTHIDCKIIETTDDQLLVDMITSNATIIPTKPMEYTRALLKILARKWDMNRKQLAQMVGKSQAWITQRLSLMRLPKEVQELVNDGKIPLQNAYTLTKLVLDPPISQEAWDEYIEKAQELGQKEFQGKVQTFQQTVKEARKNASGISATPTRRIPVLRKKSHLENEYLRLSDQVENRQESLFQDEFDVDSFDSEEDFVHFCENCSVDYRDVIRYAFSQGYTEGIGYSLQIDDKSWDDRKTQEETAIADRKAKSAAKKADKKANTVSQPEEEWVPETEELVAS